jgi:hypothetical protein
LEVAVVVFRALRAFFLNPLRLFYSKASGMYLKVAVKDLGVAVVVFWALRALFVYRIRIWSKTVVICVFVDTCPGANQS